MPLTTATALTLLQNAKRVAILPRATEDLDSVAAGLALAEVLTTKGVTATVVLEKDQDHTLQFLDTWKHVIGRSNQPQELTIEIPTRPVPIQSISYERQPQALLIHVTPERNTIQPNSVKVRTGTASLGDVLVTIGVRRPQELGKRFTDSAELFYQKPTVAIDYHVDAETFATVSLYDASARSSSVLMHELLSALPGKLPRTVATTLLAGVLAKSASFQREMTSPREFEVAADLLDLGADRHTVVQHLYKTKPLPTLKLWGRLLARLVADPLERAWSVMLSAKDFSETNTEPAVLAEVVREVLTSSAQAELITVTYELPSGEVGILAASPRGPLARQLFDRLQQNLRITVAEQNEHFVHARARGNAQQVYTQVRQLGEQIARPGYTGPIQHAQRIPNTRRTPVPATQRARNPERTPPAPAVRRG